ncbi:MAG TPA: metallophosphoesterase family protein [Nitrolancea sp.]|jgi:predicted phosphodiesterase|nr:metallophosphoesterase family protein [Nitrolancea sp.]
MTLGKKVALFADVHGAYSTLEHALDQCQTVEVTTIALLGDLFDRAEQADRCALALSGWDVIGVYGNHEREVAVAAGDYRGELRDETLDLLSGLQARVLIDDVCFTHEEEQWGQHDLLARIRRGDEQNGHHPDARITFAGHTHFRSARDEHGPLDISRGMLMLSDRRRYLINPGALASGQYAIWDRESHVVLFHQIER